MDQKRRKKYRKGLRHQNASQPSEPADQRPLLKSIPVRSSSPTEFTHVFVLWLSWDWSTDIRSPETKRTLGRLRFGSWGNYIRRTRHVSRRTAPAMTTRDIPASPAQGSPRDALAHQLTKYSKPPPTRLEEPRPYAASSQTQLNQLDTASPPATVTSSHPQPRPSSAHQHLPASSFPPRSPPSSSPFRAWS
jgi:hypothetical protein